MLILNSNNNNRSRNCDTGWVLCHISMAFTWIPLKPQKRHSYNSHSIYIAIFSLLHPGIYPVGMTDCRPYFMRIIGYNSVNSHRIPTKLGTENFCNKPFKCTKFLTDWSTHLCFMANFVKCAKRSRRKTTKKNKKNTGTLVARILEMAWEIFFKFCK